MQAVHISVPRLALAVHVQDALEVSLEQGALVERLTADPNIRISTNSLVRVFSHEIINFLLSTDRIIPFRFFVIPVGPEVK